MGVKTGADPMFCHRFEVPVSVDYLRTVFNCSKNGLVISWCYMYSSIMKTQNGTGGIDRT